MATMQNALEELTEADQLAVQAAMVEMDQKQTMKLFSTISNVAFNECVNSFRGRALEKSESKCIENIVGKYMQHFQRTNVRFGEEFMARNQAAAAAAAQQQGK